MDKKLTDTEPQYIRMLIAWSRTENQTCMISLFQEYIESIFVNDVLDILFRKWLQKSVENKEALQKSENNIVVAIQRIDYKYKNLNCE